MERDKQNMTQFPSRPGQGITPNAETDNPTNTSPATTDKAALQAELDALNAKMATLQQQLVAKNAIGVNQSVAGSTTPVSGSDVPVANSDKAVAMDWSNAPKLTAVEPVVPESTYPMNDLHKQFFGTYNVDTPIARAWTRLYDRGIKVGEATAEAFLVDEVAYQYFQYGWAEMRQSYNANVEVEFFDARGIVGTESGA